MGVDLLKKWGPSTKYKQNANLGNSYYSYKDLHQANTVVSQYSNICRTVTSNTDWNMTRNHTKFTHVESSIGGKIMQKYIFSKSGGTCPHVHPMIVAHACQSVCLSVCLVVSSAVSCTVRLSTLLQCLYRDSLWTGLK